MYLNVIYYIVTYYYPFFIDLKWMKIIYCLHISDFKYDDVHYAISSYTNTTKQIINMLVNTPF